MTDRKKRYLDGQAGEAIGADEMVEIEHVHTDSEFYLGGAHVTDEFAEQIGTDGYALTAKEAANLAQQLLNIEH